MDPRLPIAPTIRSEDLAAELIREVDATAHSVAIKPVDWPKIRATAEGLAWAEADSADVEEVEVAGRRRWRPRWSEAEAGGGGGRRR